MYTVHSTHIDSGKHLSPPPGCPNMIYELIILYTGAFLEIEAGGYSKVQKKNGAARIARAILRPRIYCGVSFIHPTPPPCSLAAKKYSTLPKKRAAPTILL